MDARDAVIRQAQQERLANDTKILQKVNAVNRMAFTQRFPGQVHHCMRLVAERLQAVLTAKPTDLTDPDTWQAQPADILALTQALEALSRLHQQYPQEAE